MDKNITVHYTCIPNSSGFAAIAVALLGIPFHILIIKILVKDVGLSLPHHQIILSLTLSDALQMLSASGISSMVQILNITTGSVTCTILRDTIVFTTSLTIIVSTLSLITFAIERMMICMHFLQYRSLFRKKIVKRVLGSFWLIAIIVAAIATILNDARTTETSVSEATPFQIICSIIILPSALIITTFYLRIYLFSRERLTRVTSNPVSRDLRDITTFNKKQMQIAFVAGIVCVSYLACMVPMATNFFLELAGVIDNHPSNKVVFICFSMFNTIADPMIYGLGMTQTRQVLIRTLKKISPW